MKALFAVAALSISGCAVTPNIEAIGPEPNDYQTIVADYIKKTYYDPYSIRDARISQAMKGHIFNNQGWLVCVSLNAKNKFGAYTGIGYTAFLLNRGKVIKYTNRMTSMCDDKRVKWSEFKQLNS